MSPADQLPVTANGPCKRPSTLTQLDRGSILALRRSTVDFGLGGQRSYLLRWDPTGIPSENWGRNIASGF